MKKIFMLTGVLLAVVFCVSSCRKCEEPIDVSQSGLFLIFKNSAGMYLYKEVNSLYDKDSLTIYDEVGNRYPAQPYLNSIPGTLSSYWEFQFRSLYNSQADSESFNREICKNFIVRYNQIENDTIRTCFRANKTKCGSVLTSLKVFNKGVLLTELNNQIFATVTVIKN